MNYNKIHAVTGGERLFQRLTTLGGKALVSSRLGQHPFIKLAGRGQQFGDYLEGAVYAFTFKRLMKATHGIFENASISADAGNRELTRLLSQWFDWLTRDEIATLMRDTLRAHAASNKAIAKGIKHDMFGPKRLLRCCFCGVELRPDGKGVFRDPRGNRATLEHIWPSSLGGDSIENNLAPACHECNREKDDLFIWEQGLVHNFVYPINFQNSDYLARVPIYERLLLQRRAVILLAQRDQLSLKQALLQVGAYGTWAAIDPGDTWDFFNIQNHSVNLGERLW